MKYKFHTSLFLLLGCILGVLTACSAFPGSTQPALPIVEITIPGVPKDATPLFAENCAACHGPSGEGGGIAPALNSGELRARLDDKAIRQTIAFGRPGTAMPVWGDRLTEAEIEALVALIRNWDKMNDEQLAALAEQAEEGCRPGMGMHPGMGGHEPMMGMGCGRGQSRMPWWFPFKP